jgi:rod shape-determining protein MreD
MIRIVLRFLNTPILIILVAVGVAIQSSLFYSWPLSFFQPDVVLLVVVWCALKRHFEEGGIITLIIASINEIHSAAPQGFFMINYMLIYLLIRAASRIIMVPTIYSFSMASMWAFLGWKLFSLVLLNLFGAPLRTWQYNLSLLLIGSVVEGVLAYGLYRWFEKFDWITYKNSKAEHSISQDLMLDGEGY